MTNKEQQLPHGLLEAVASVIREAGKQVVENLNSEHTYSYKSDGSFATEIDISVEIFLKKELQQLFPQAGIIAEESALINSNSPWSWVIDPIDGTTNFARRIPFFCLSVALTYNDEPYIALTYDPVREELFHSERGKGFYVNNQRTTVSTRTLSESIVEVELIFEGQTAQHFFEQLSSFNQKVYGVRKLGSSCLSLAYIAAGRLDGVFFRSFKWWDIAAGVLLVQEAGGRVSALNGLSINRLVKSCFATNFQIFDDFCKIFPTE